MSRCRSYQKRSEETSAMLKVAKQTTTKQEEEQVNEKFGTINNNNNNNNSQNKQTKNATHTTLTLIQQKKKSNENNNNNFVKNFVDEKNVKMQTNDEAHKKQTPTQQQKQKQEKEQKEQKDKLEVVKKYQKSVQKELEKFDLINMKTTNDLIKTTSIGEAAAGATKTTMMMPTPTLTSTSSSSSSSSSSSFLTATCDSSSNNKKSVSVLGNNNNNNNNTNHMDNCVGSSISVSGSSNNNNKSEIINSNHNNNNNNNNRNTNNSIKFIESNGILQIKIEECDENVQIKTETTEIETNSSSSGECSGSSSSSGSGSSISMQLTTAMNDDNNHQNNQQKQQQNQNDNEIINKSSKHNHNNNKNVVTEKQQQQPQQQHLQQQQEQNDPNDLIFARPKPVPLTVVNPHIICNLCYGYLIDATTIVECLHSFCHSCLIKHLRTEQYCPRCEMMINTAKPNIKPDTTLQAIVYKLVPGLYEKEFLRRRAFYKNHPEEAALATPEQRGDDTEHLIFSPTEYMSISLEYADIDEHLGSNTADEYSELLHPRYIQCPAKFTVGLLKKFVYSKFSIDIQRFSIDIMYKVKTIVLLDHYTVMDVAYIYTWKRDAPMRFYFRVKESFKPLIKQENLQQTNSSNTTSYDQRMMTVIHTPITTPNSSPSKNSNIRNNNNATTKLLPLTEIKIEEEIESSMPRTPTIEKRFEIVSPRSASGDKKSNGTNGEADNLKITIVSKPIKDTESGVTSNTSTSSSFSSSTKTPKQSKEKRMNFLTSSTPTAAAASEDSSPKDERKIENIKLKIDLSKQNSVTIINMSDPERKEIVKPVNNRSIEKEWKVKNKKEPTNGFKSQANGKAATTNLTVPPLTLNRTSLNSTTTTTTAKLSPKGGTSPTNIIPTTVEQFNLNEKEDPKSEFLKSFALAPINSMKNTSVESPKKQQATTTLQTSSSTKSSSSQKPQQQHQKSPPKSKVNTNNSNLNFVFKTPAAKPLSMPLLPKILPLVQASKRKSKEPMKTTTKKPKLLPLMTTTPTATPTQTPQATAAKDFELKEKDDFKIKLPTKDNSLSEKKSAISTTVTVNGKPSVEQQLMPPPSSLPSMRPPSSIASKKACKSNNNAVSKIPTSNGGIMPHPTLPGVQVAAPGNRTPIAKRYQPILPKTTRPNPFADLPSAVNQILKDNGTEIKSISSEKTTNLNSSKVLSGNHQAKLMGPPPLPKQKTQQPLKTPTSASSSSAGGGSGSTSTSSSSSIAQNSYLNYALFNASKSKGNEVPPGCRTPMYSPNSPIYSPSSPQYAPNYNIPTVPQYKYTPKPSSAVGAASTANSSESILQSILGGNSNAMASLFPSPPTKQQKAGESINKKTAANSKKTDSPQQQQQNSQKRAYPFARSPSPSTSISSNSSPTREDPPEKQLKVKSLLNSCNINIPSSLSITITRDDGESASNNVTYPKHKSPVNNYIEILKLPDPATSTSTTAATTTISSETTTALKNFRPHNNNSNNNNSGQRTTPPPPLPTATPTTLSAGKTTTTTISMPQLKKAPPPPNVTMRTYEITRQNQIKPPNSSPTTTTATTKISTPKTSPAGEANLELKSTPNQKQNQIQQIEKKFTSPEKRNAATAGFNQTSTSPSTSTSTNDSNKSPPKSLNTNVDGTKKFRPILPRQDAQAISEILPKVNSPSGIIGTYVSPSGATVNVHGNNKKVTTTAPKKSPSSMQINKQQQQKATQQNCTQQQQLMHNAFKSGAPRTIASSRYSPSTNSNSGNKQQQQQQQQQHNNNALLNSMQTATKKTTTTTPPTTSSPKGFYSSNKMMSNLPTSMQQAQPPQPPQQQSSPKVSSTTAATTANVSLSSSTSPQNAVANAAVAAAAQLALMSSASASAAAQQSNAAAAAAAAQPDFTKLLKENLLRAQVQAAAASAAAANPAANMLYSYANIAAAQQMYNATTAPLYSYQHAYIVEQISRMQRANNEALLGEYLQKIKAGMDNGNIINNNPIAGQSAINQEPRNNTKSSVNAAAAAPAAGVVNKDAVGNKAQTQANKAK